MIENAAGRVARHIKSVVPNHPVHEEDMQHTLIIIMNTAAVVLFTLIGVLFTGRGSEVIMLLKCFALLRLVSGGLHLESSMGCAIVTAGTATLLSTINANTTWTISLTAISMLVVLIYAPSGIENQSRIPERFYPLLPVISFFIVASNLWFLSSMAAIAFFVQAMTLVINEHFMKRG
ncbi:MULTISPECIES: accessory gene regulator B family protein [unclassified Paenibacillus]|uniref:accessory gene regulator B family protein n=1 Tax=unclassified Paenibacillus TaxID=185978 RepID=UPI0009A707A4|nr:MULTISPECIES: accessory gene regulator B family protein [unclassified Paenibacillus]SLK21714.1 accessory gene regulator B [Paenibacillus sp. RU5A]SOC76712.1 accessory gene regulator B [Paenibacillus sp. RU26A]SOC78103.1 accessory gene regulator B [Paenibacillus sp. RU5M]